MGFADTSEKDIQRIILDYLRLKGAKAIRVNSGAVTAISSNGNRRFVRFNSEPGCSDIVVCYRGRFLTIEVKKPGARTEKQRAEKQESFAQDVRNAGGMAIIATDLKDVVELLERVDESLRAAG